MVNAAHKEGIAVCRSASRHDGTQRTAGAAPIVDNHALLELLSKLMRQRSGKRIGAATCWERNDNSDGPIGPCRLRGRSEEHTSELQSLMRISYAVFCFKKKTNN